MIRIEPAEFNRILRGAGLSVLQISEIGAEFSKHNDTLDDEALLDMLLLLGKDMHTVITIFEKIGIGRQTAVFLIEARQKRILGGIVDIRTMEVEG